MNSDSTYLPTPTKNKFNGFLKLDINTNALKLGYNPNIKKVWSCTKL